MLHSLSAGHGISIVEVKKKDSVLKLRDETGVPVWAGWRRRLKDCNVQSRFYICENSSLNPVLP